jgi:predicted acetyltransferase
VATDPGFRRRGLMRRLMTGLLQRSRDNGVPLSILWASMGAIYQRLGYGLASYHVRYELDPRDIGFQFGAPAAGCTRRLETAQAREVVALVYRDYVQPRNLLLHRTPEMWEAMLRRQNDRDTHVAVHYDSSGVPEAYCIYQVHWPGPSTPLPNHVMHVHDFAWTTANGYRGIWQFLAGHDLVRKLVWMPVPEDDPAPAMFLEPRCLNRRTVDGIWLRVVDAAKALAARGYDLPGEATLRVLGDELCPWNDGVYRLSTGGGERAEVERVDGTQPQIEVTPNALASLIIGQFNASQLWRAGRLESAEPELLPRLDALFSTRYRPTCANGF